MADDQDRLTTQDLADREPGDRDDVQNSDQQDNQPSPLFSDEDAGRLRSQWDDVQAAFVDEPRRAVEQADGLVADTIQRLATSFSDERGRLEQQWARGEDVSTEDLRVALQRYRSFFHRLLSL